MGILKIVTIFLAVSPFLLAAGQSEDDFLYDKFPPNFMWGLATSAYQIEGGAFEDGKGLTNWDYWAHNGSYEGWCNVFDCENGDVGPDSYHLYEQDTDLLREIGANFYRFSLSWARIVPTGRIKDGINQKGIDHYNRVINSLLAAGIQPFITLYHWDLPLPLTWDGSWSNEEIVYHFRDYARIAFESFGDRVKLWLTFNEPHVFCLSDWTWAYKEPFNGPNGETSHVYPPVKPYECGHNVVKAHALAWRLYDEEFRPTQNGEMGITLNCDWPEPFDPTNASHLEASDRSMHFHYGWWAHPLMYGEYPPIMRELIDQHSIDEGFPESRLPSFDANWTQIINGTLDFLGLNHYFSYYLVPEDDEHQQTWINSDADIFEMPHDEDWNRTATGWPITPFGIKNVTKWIWNEYQMPIYITENGYGHWSNDTTTDPIRVDFYKEYINNVLRSIKLFGADIRSYTAWSLLDNLEWTSGSSIRFGVHHVDYESPNKTRTPKDSALYLKQLFSDNGFPEP